MNDVPSELIFNYVGPNSSSLCTHRKWTVHCAGETIIPIANSYDTGQITAIRKVHLTPFM